MTTTHQPPAGEGQRQAAAIVHLGDCIEVMRGLPANRFHCVVTSPPYFNLRDYQQAGQIGLEPTVEEFIAKLVAVFRGVRRILRDDGVCFINMGDSYFGSSQTGGTNSKEGSAKRAGGMFSKTADGRRAAACGTYDTELEDLKGRDCLCGSLCDACRAAYQLGKAHSGSQPAPTPTLSLFAPNREHKASASVHLPTSGSCLSPTRTAIATLDRSLSPATPASAPLGGLASTTNESCEQLSASNSLASSPAVSCRLCGRSLLDCVQPSDGRTVCTCGTIPPSDSSHHGTLGTSYSGLAYPYLTTKSLKPKDLIGVPWMLAFALRADGWYLRSDVIWHKPSVMPESVTDRPTKSHEYIFLLTKNARYYYDAEAIKEPTVNDSLPGPNMTDTAEVYGTGNGNSGLLALRRTYIANGLPSTRNKRTVWTIPSQGWDEAHFATYPPALVEPCIKAGTSERGCCAECGAPWVRIVDRERRASRPGTGSKVHGLDNLTIGNRDPQRHVTESRTVGWKASCECGAAVVPCRVFDPFTGSGTTLAVANQLGRDAEGSELNPEYKKMAERRIGRANKPNTFRDESKAEASGLFNASEQP